MKDHSLMMRLSYGLCGGKKKTTVNQGYIKDLQAVLTLFLMILLKLGNINFCGSNSNNCVIFSASAQQPRLKSFIILTRQTVIRS